jgi:hypothetical protein
MGHGVEMGDRRNGDRTGFLRKPKTETATASNFVFIKFFYAYGALSY